VSETRSELDQAAELAAHKRLRRARAPWTSMALSLLVVVGVAFVLVLIVPRVNQVTQPPVDVPLGARAAASQVAFTPSVPVGLPDGWRATSVRTTRSTAWVVATGCCFSRLAMSPACGSSAFSVSSAASLSSLRRASSCDAGSPCDGFIRMSSGPGSL